MLHGPRKLIFVTMFLNFWQLIQGGKDVFSSSLTSGPHPGRILPHRGYLAVIRDTLGRRQWHPTPVLLPGKSHGRRSLQAAVHGVELDTTEQLHFRFSLSRTGEGNGNPLQCSCLENPRDGGSWWAAVYGVTQSRTRLKRLSSSSRDTLSELGKQQTRRNIQWREARNAVSPSIVHRSVAHPLLLNEEFGTQRCQQFWG